MELKVYSLRVENRTYEGVFDDPTNGIINVLNCVDDKGYRYELTIYEEDRDCYSGYCGSTYGNAYLRRVDEFIGTTHVPKIKNLKFEIADDIVTATLGNATSYGRIMYVPDMKNDIFTIDYVHENMDYYPNAECTVNMDLFEPIIRAKEKRPVWIFKGDSGLGKSYLAGIIRESNREKVIYETDSNPSINKDEIKYSDIIVIGNKYNYEIDEIKSFLEGDTEIIAVNFDLM